MSQAVSALLESSDRSDFSWAPTYDLLSGPLSLGVWLVVGLIFALIGSTVLSTLHELITLVLPNPKIAHN